MVPSRGALNHQTTRLPQFHVDVSELLADRRYARRAHLGTRLERNRFWFGPNFLFLHVGHVCSPIPFSKEMISCLMD